MNLAQKLILVFSLLMLVTVAVLTARFSTAEMNEMQRKTADSMTEVGTRMIGEFEQTIKLLEFTAETLVSNINLMDCIQCMFGIDAQEEETSSQVATQTMISSILYRTPSNADIYRINVFNRSGFFISSRFEKSDTLYSYSEEAHRVISGLDWLDEADSNLSGFVILPPHADYWTTTPEKKVFSLARALVWHGQTIGYLELSMPHTVLQNIFTVLTMEGVSAQAIFDNGEVLYKDAADQADYTALAPAGKGLHYYKEAGVSDRFVIKLRNDALKLNVFIAQDVGIHNRTLNQMIRYNFFASLALYAMVVIVIIVLSMGLTGSIRRLTRKVTNLQHRDFIQQENWESAMVTSRRDKEIYNLEKAFDDLISHLQVSMGKEIATRQLNIESQLNALQAQINPHFIYNTLNIVSAKAMECGNEDIIDICNQFADMLRYSSDFQNKSATLAEELHHVRCFLMLAKARYEDIFEYTIDVPREHLGIILPKLTLQPIVENSFAHGRKDGVMHIRIASEKKNGWFIVSIADDGPGFSPEVLERFGKAMKEVKEGPILQHSSTSRHIGLINTYKRLNYFGNGTIDMRIYNHQGAVVELLFPNLGEEDARV